MMKKVLLIGLLLAVSLLLVSCNTGKAGMQKIPLPVITPTYTNCVDSDNDGVAGMQNYAKAGQVSLSNPGSKAVSVPDTCVNKTTLNEYYCKKSGNYYFLGTDQHTCNKSSEVCKDRACVKQIIITPQPVVIPKPQITCTDSDGGNNTAVKGTTTGCQDSSCSNVTTITDCCYRISGNNQYAGCFATGDGVGEGVCQGNMVYEPYIPCPNGCSDGVCLPASANTCTDSDGGWNYTVKGQANGLDSMNRMVYQKDSCNTAGFLVEYGCNSTTNLVGSTTLNCSTQVLPGSVCVDGACIAQTSTPDISCGTVVSKEGFLGMGGELYQYLGADSLPNAAPKVKFKNNRTGDTYEYPVHISPNGIYGSPFFNVPQGGKNYPFTNASGVNLMNWNLRYLCDADLACTDSDGGRNYSVQGTTKGISDSGWGFFRTATDSCLNNNTLSEYTCVSSAGYADAIYPIVIGGEQVSCPNGCSNGACAQPPYITCTDSDGGQNYSVKGTVSRVGYTSNFVDNCSDQHTLTEYYCNNVNTPSIKSYVCPNNCVDGACVTTCGNGVQDSGEQCDGNAWAVSASCQYFGYTGGTLGCLNTCTFDFRNCINQTTYTSCTDSDGGNNTAVKGTTTGCEDSSCIHLTTITDCCYTKTSNNQFTGCSATGTGVGEGTCQGNIVYEPYIDCPNSCQDGACLQTPVLCNETDGGLNYNLKGHIHGMNDGLNTIVDKDDYCDSSGLLSEYYCAASVGGAIKVRNNFVNCSTQFGLGSICQNGACVAPSCTPKTCAVQPGLNKHCGIYDDGCGSTINCGSCTNGTCYLDNSGKNGFCVPPSLHLVCNIDADCVELGDGKCRYPYGNTSLQGGC